MGVDRVLFPLRLPAELKDFLQSQAEVGYLSLNAYIVSVLSTVRGFESARTPARATGVAAPAVRAAPAPAEGVSELVSKVSRNALCPCGSGLKYKRCCASLNGGSVGA